MCYGFAMIRKVRVFMNSKTGMSRVGGVVLRDLSRYWDVPGIDISYQISKHAADGQAKALRAIREGVDTILVVGGDGIVNTIGRALIGSEAALGVIPAGSGNGFARHFGIPLAPERAVDVLRRASRKKIDVGTANGSPFFVTCGMAWDAALVRSFEKAPVRGIVQYVFAAAYEFIGYIPQPMEAVLDGDERLRFADPVVFTVANLTQYGGGARIAPQACPDDGYLEMVVMRQENIPLLLTNLNRLFDGTIDKLPEVVTRRFRELEVLRQVPAPVQLDGELVDLPARISVRVLPQALTVLVPEEGERA